MIWKTIEYPLLATAMTKHQIDLIISPVLQIGLPRSGRCRNMARALFFSEIDYQGLGMKHPYVTQGLRKLLALADKSPSMTSEVLQSAWGTCMLLCGLGEYYLLEPFHPIGPTLERCWMTTLWEFLDVHHIKVARATTTFIRFDGDCFLCQCLQHLTSEI
jgi:hypothetical protein